MERIIRICEITGRMTIEADNLIHDEATAFIIERSKVDEFGEYRRVKL